ncbi:hypothetical protein AK37_22787 [Rhodococcus pyridinivorans AK37]|uniref:ChsH2 rubredoxin-like zinc ribbon domain-containing protein n=1 Tax=Rhodococcus pyridinivorans AK37 TaxID=1114960 RepID=H0JXS6_9NOCA|nr:hypothetical protein AK37_22787 [Rhodococcus pyridinivorans AK37]
MTTKALAPDVSTWPAENPQLIGSRCDDCSATTWPTQPRCPPVQRGKLLGAAAAASRHARGMDHAGLRADLIRTHPIEEFPTS